MYESSTKETSGCASNLLAHEDLGHFEEAHRRNIQAKFYNEKFSLVYESDNIKDFLYEEHGATLKHKCGKGYVVDIVFVAKPPFISLHTCHSCIIAHPGTPP